MPHKILGTRCATSARRLREYFTQHVVTCASSSIWILHRRINLWRVCCSMYVSASEIPLTGSSHNTNYDYIFITPSPTAYSAQQWVQSRITSLFFFLLTLSSLQLSKIKILSNELSFFSFSFTNNDNGEALWFRCILRVLMRVVRSTELKLKFGLRNSELERTLCRDQTMPTGEHAV